MMHLWQPLYTNLTFTIGVQDQVLNTNVLQSELSVMHSIVENFYVTTLIMIYYHC